MLRYLLTALIPLLLAIVPADAHFFGATQEIDGYHVIFQPIPSSPEIGANSTLNFSILQDGDNLFNVYAAVVVQNKSTGEIVFQHPYRQYWISDITVPYVFTEPADYAVSIETRILEHEKYQTQPLSATFDVSASQPGMPIDEILIYYVTPATVAAAIIAVYLHSRSMI